MSTSSSETPVDLLAATIDLNLRAALATAGPGGKGMSAAALGREVLGSYGQQAVWRRQIGQARWGVAEIVDAAAVLGVDPSALVPDSIRELPVESVPLTVEHLIAVARLTGLSLSAFWPMIAKASS